MLENAAKPESTILCADDTEAQRYAMARVLRGAGFNVLEAGTGRQALEMMRSQPDLVVLDVNLPDMSGLDVCKQIKSNEATSRTPVLHVSATFVSTEARVAGLEGGADAYLIQPIQPEELIATVRALLRVRKFEEAFWESQQQYRSFFEANPLACWVFDTSDLKILAVNAAAVEQYGYSREEFTNLTMRDIPRTEEWPSILELLHDSGRASHPPLTWKHRIKGGQLVDVEMSLAPLELNGHDLRLAIVQDMTEKLKLQAAEQKEEMRRLLLDRVLHVQEDERRRIARELHDETGQLMTSLLVGLRSLSDARRLADAKVQAKRLREIASAAIDELGRLARGLHSSVLDDLGLETAIRRYADEFSQAHHIQVDLEFENAQLSTLNENEQFNLYRIVQEALTNVARHSHAGRASVAFKADTSELRLTIQDDGRGFSTAHARNSPPGHLGIEGMRQRAAILGGTLQLFSEPEQGVCIDLRIPLSNRPTFMRATG
jgi:PAS domain S-box-containing protein